MSDLRTTRCTGCGEGGSCRGGGAVIRSRVIIRGSASGCKSGNSASASSAPPLKVNVASIHPRLRVRMLPADSNVESSNIACLPRLFSRADREACERRKAPVPLCALERGERASRPSVHPHRNHCVHVDTAPFQTVPAFRHFRKLLFTPFPTNSVDL